MPQKANMLFVRNINSTAIAYFLITNDTTISYANFITAPKEFRNILFETVPTYPLDIIQIYRPEFYFFHKCNSLIDVSLNFNVVLNPKDVPELLKACKSFVSVFFIDDVENISSIIQDIKQKDNTYFTILNDKSELQYDKSDLCYFSHALQLIEYIKRDIESILPNEYLQIIKDAKLKKDSVEKIPIFKGAHVNFFILSQISGNYWKFKERVSGYSQEYLNDKSSEIIKNTAQGIDTDSRLSLFRSQFEDIDKIYSENSLGIAVTDIDSKYPPLIVAAPFQNPQADKLSKIYGIELPEEIHELLYAEQNKNYVYTEKTNKEFKEYVYRKGSILARFTHSRTCYIDLMLYLHSTFTFSPSIRFPIIGKSIIKELSYLQPKTRNQLEGNKLNKTIKKFGKKLNELILNKKIEEYISKRNSQIVVISDLPFEWLEINHLPIAYTHDICRLPETNLKNVASYFNQNNNICYVIPENIAQRTLVIFGVPENEPEFQKAMELSISECKRLNIRYKKCLTVNDFISEVKEFRPEFLIIDCHGNFNEEDLSSYLNIANEKLTHEHIVNNELYVPIVFLSACVTSPTYGYVHSIVNAFFTTGSFCVTSTYLPINITNGTITYLRALWHLDNSAKNGDYANWLSYISMVIRSSFINLIVKKISERKRFQSTQNQKKLDKIIAELDRIKDLTVTFPKRRETFEKMDILLNNIDENLRFEFKKIMQENLLYTHIGRADLIKFQSWLSRKNIKLNQFKTFTTEE